MVRIVECVKDGTWNVVRIVECVEDSRMCRGLYCVERMVERANG